MYPDRDYVLPVDKPPGPSSHRIVTAARRALAERRVGHCGTLDPFASGLLILCAGRATRLAEYLTGVSKAYLATARLGMETRSHDTETPVAATSNAWRELSPWDVEAVLVELRGEIVQVPPRYSAKKVGGIRAYEVARSGGEPTLAPRRVTVHRFELERWEPPLAVFQVECSAGTYVRSLARDLGRRLGVGAHLVALRRTRSGPIGIEQAVPFALIGDARAVAGARLDPLEALAHLPHLRLDEAAVEELRFGRAISVGTTGTEEAGCVRLSYRGRLAAVADVEPADHAGLLLRPRKVFLS